MIRVVGIRESEISTFLIASQDSELCTTGNKVCRPRSSCCEGRVSKFDGSDPLCSVRCPGEALPAVG